MESPVTVEQFLSLLHDGERWLELEAGTLIRHDPPDVVHGNVIHHVSRTLAAHFRQRPECIACFDLGLILGRNPDTILCPAVSCFALPGGFDEADKLVTDSVPRLVIDVASTNDRRSNLASRVQALLTFGVQAVWVFDTVDRHVHRIHPGDVPRRFSAGETLRDALGLPGFEFPVADAFVDPKWWSANSQRS